MNYLSLFLALGATAFVTPAHAQQDNNPSYNAKQASDYQQRFVNFDPAPYEQDLKAVQRYLSTFKSLSSRFRQTTAGTSGINMGDVIIQKPGKARWEYKVPTKRLVIVNDDKLTYFDQQLGEVTHAETPPPLALFLANDFDLLGDSIRILDVTKHANTLAVALTPESNIQDNKLSFESLILTFALNPVELNRIQTIDTNNHAVTLELTRPKLGEKFDESLFTFTDPRPLKERRNINPQ